MNLREISPPTAEPLTVEEVRVNLRITIAEPESPPDPAVALEDANIARLIKAARKHAEQVTGRVLTDAVYEWRIPSFSRWCPIELPAGDVGAIDSIVYLQDDGSEATLAESVYYVEDAPAGAKIWLLRGQEWPSSAYLPDAVRIRFRSLYGAGIYSPPYTVPETILTAMHLMVGHWHENREEVADRQTFEIPLGAMHLLKLERVEVGV